MIFIYTSQHNIHTRDKKKKKIRKIDKFQLLLPICSGTQFVPSCEAEGEEDRTFIFLYKNKY